MVPLLKSLSRIIWELMKKLDHSIKAESYIKKGILGMNIRPNSVPLANNQQFGQRFDVEKIIKPYPLITDKNLDSLAKIGTR